MHWGLVAGVALAFVVLVSCDGAGTDPPSEASPTPPEPVRGMRGEVVAVSDVQGEGERPLRDGFVLAVPVDHAEDLWTAGDRGTPLPHELPYWNPRLPLSAVEEATAALAPLDDDGAFALDAAPGPYLVCLSLDEIEDPLRLWGCEEATLDHGAVLRLTWGEGGLQLD